MSASSLDRSLRKSYLDLEYANPSGHPVHLDLHLPAESSKALPLIIWIHGGDWRGYDWMRGDKALCPVLSYTDKGYAVASVQYRLAPEFNFPEQLIDCKAAARWLRAHASEFGIDPARFVAWGFGGGALLANLLATTSDTDVFDRGEHLDQSSAAQAVVDTNGISYLYWSVDHNPLAYWITCYFNLQRNAMLRSIGLEDGETAFFGGPMNSMPKVCMSASPGSYVASKAMPPILIVTGTESRIVSFSQRTRYFKELRRESQDATILYVNGNGQGGARLFEHPLVSVFLARHIEGREVPGCEALGQISVSTPGERDKVYSNYQDELSTISMQSGTVEWWSNPIRGFSHPLVEERSCWSSILKREVQYLVCLPPSYHREPERRFPTLYINTVGVITVHEHSLDFVELPYAAMLAGKMPEMIIVLPNNAFAQYKDRRVGVYLQNKSERMLMKDFIPHVDETFRTIPRAEGRALQASCGGSIENLAFAVRRRRPLFSVVSVSAPLFRPGVLRLLKRRRKAIGRETVIQLCHDRKDSFGVGAEGTKLVEAMRANGIAFDYIAPSAPGLHTWIEFALATKGNAFEVFVQRFGAHDPRFAQAPETGARRYDDLAYAKRGDRELRLDLRMPESPSAPVPLVVWIHGTDWRGALFNEGDKRPCPAETLVSDGYAVASVEYRFAAEAPFPAAIDDVRDAVAWLRARAAQYGLDASRVALCGDSSGGALALLAVLRGPGAIDAQAVVSCSAPTDLGSLDAMRWRDVLGGGAIHGHPSSGVSKFLGGKEPRAASPIAFAAASAPPHLFIHGALDRVVSPRQSGLMHRGLIACGADSRLAIVDEGGHGFASMQRQAIPLARAFLDAKLRGEPAALAGHDQALRPRVNRLGATSYPEFRDPIARENLDAAYHVLRSEILGQDWSFLLALPPSYDREPTREYPTLYLLHDVEESPRDYFNYIEMRRDAMLAQAAPEAIVVIVNASCLGEYRDASPGPRVETALTRELLLHVEARWRARPTADARWLEGFGLGANAALRLAFKRPETFGAASAICPVAEPASWAGDGVADWLAANLDAARASARMQLVGLEGATETDRLAQLFESQGVPYRRLTSGLATDDPLIAYLEGDFDVFAFQRDPSIAREVRESVEVELI